LNRKPVTFPEKISRILHMAYDLLDTNNIHFTIFTSGAQIFQKPRSCLKVLGARRVMLSKFHTEDLQILGATLQNSVTMVTWRLGFVHPHINISYNVALHELQLYKEGLYIIRSS
jgi:hypothetical protein